jgi:hypothetical protein
MSVCCRNLACWTAEGSAGPSLREGISGSGWRERSQRILAIHACLREGRGTACRLGTAGGP